MRERQSSNHSTAASGRIESSGRINDFVVAAGRCAERGACTVARDTPSESSRRRAVIRLRLARTLPDDPFADFEAIMESRQREADAFYEPLQHTIDRRAATAQRQAWAGMIWCKQYYAYDVTRWLEGIRTADAAGIRPPMQSPLAAYRQRRRHLDAGRMGIRAPWISRSTPWSSPRSTPNTRRVSSS